MTDRAFVDTNVLVYAVDSTDPRKHRIAVDLLRDLRARSALRVSVQVLREFLVTATRKLTPPLSTEQAWEVVDALVDEAEIVVERPGMLRGASALAARASLSFWDALVVVSAAEAGATVVFTEDLNSGETQLGVRFSNPFA